ncbi:MAG TPA: acetoin utilization protein AcuC, partial [Candidatus Limnocylindrales bacterium]|nr:acetoin utilization protein AcuC [Candidatus Limnocylindrales bacterium]
MADQPLLVFGPRSLDYDFGPSHPLTPRRFGPGIDLLRSLGAEPGLAPEPATDGELLLCHTRRYVDVVRRFSEADLGWMEVEAGIGSPDNPAFHGMHDAAAAVAGGSIRAIEAVLRGEVEHAFHPGGGLHHAMASRASGFCVYDDPALAIAVARGAGLRVLYVDLDVHHGDGVEAIHAADPGVLTISFHESGRYLFPGTGFADEVGEGRAAGTVVNVPMEPDTGEAAWLAAVRLVVPELAASFAPDVVVSQHGADSHAWDPLAHLRNTTTAMAEAARLVDMIAHRHASGRWLATGGGGYGVYDVVPRSWSLVWLAAAHAEAPDRLPSGWRERWADAAARHGVQSLPTAFVDPANVGDPVSASQAAAERRTASTAAAVREVVVPAIVRGAVDRGWWDPAGSGGSAARPAVAPAAGATAPTIVP